MSEGGSVPFVPITIVDLGNLDNPDALFTFSDPNRDDPWERNAVVRQVFTQVLGCSPADFDRVWSRPGSHKGLRQLAKAYILWDGAQRGKQLRAWRQMQREKPDVIARLFDVLDGGANPCAQAPRDPSPTDKLRDILSGRRRAARRASPADSGGLPSTQPRTGTQRPQGPLSQRALDQWIEIVTGLREWWLARRAQDDAEKQLRQASRRARRTQMAGFGDFFSGLGSTLETVARQAPSIAQAVQAFRTPSRVRPVSLPGTVPDLSTGSSGIPLPGPRLGVSAGSAALALFGEQPDVMSQGGLLEGFENEIERTGVFFRRGGRSPSARSVGMVEARNPDTGRIHFFKDMGKPVLFAGDVQACRRVRKVARRSASSVGLQFKATRRRRR